MKKLMYTLGLMILSCLIYGQTVLQGTVTDSETGEPILYGNVAVYKDGLLITGCVTDLDGKYVIINLDPGTYDVEANYLGYNLSRITSVVIEANRVNTVDIQLISAGVVLEQVVVREFKAPLIRQDETTSGAIVTGSRIRRMPTKNVNSVVGKSKKNGKRTSIRGSRTKATEYIIDGAKVSGNKTKPPMPLSSVTEEIKQAYQLTAGEVNDFLKWDLWEDIREHDLRSYKNYWGIQAKQRYVVQLSNETGTPVSGAKVRLLDESGNSLWASSTDNLGRAELWVSAFNEKDKTAREIEVQYQNEQMTLNDIKSFDQGINTLQIEAKCQEAKSVEIVFALDASGSMNDEDRFLKAELKELMNRVSGELENQDLKTAAVYYTGRHDANTLRYSDLTNDISVTQQFIDIQRMSGGNDEAIDLAIEAIVDKILWSVESHKIVFLILDEPIDQVPENIKRLQDGIRKAAEMGIRIIPLTCSGSNKSLEYLMRNTALLTNGTYLFLTDDSGIGGKHQKPTTDHFDVELLIDLLHSTIAKFIYTPPCESDGERLLANSEDVKVPTDEMNRINGKIKADKKSIKVYPNPTSGKLSITSKQQIESMYTTDMRGKIVERFSKLNKKDRIDISDYATGLYFLVWKDIKGVWHSEKVIKTNGLRGISFR